MQAMPVAHALLRAASTLVSTLVLATTIPASAQSGAYKPPRTSFGQPDLQGIWEVRNQAANGGLEAHSASAGIRAGESVIVDPPDGKIPYLPAATAKQKQNFEHRLTADPISTCYLPGVPRVTYMPYPFQIFQTPDFIALTYEYVHASRTVYLNPKQQTHPDGIDFWMGDSRAHFDGDTLVVDVADLNGSTWFDMSGNYHSDQLHVVERYTRTSPDAMTYEARIEDPQTFSRPWTIRLPLYRHSEKNAQLYEYECHVYRDEPTK